jgi:hypothetical protein
VESWTRVVNDVTKHHHSGTAAYFTNVEEVARWLKLPAQPGQPVLTECMLHDDCPIPPVRLTSEAQALLA